MHICVFGASSSQLASAYYQAAHDLGAAIAQAGHTLYFGAGDSGVMGAAARGAQEQGGRVVGVSPAFFHADGLLYDRCDELILTESMRERKHILEESADAFVAAPGGVGTYEELLEALTLRSLGLLPKPIALLNTNGCYDPFLAMLRHGAEERFLTEAVLDLLFVSDSVEAILDYVQTFTPEEHNINYYKAIEEES